MMDQRWVDPTILAATAGVYVATVKSWGFVKKSLHTPASTRYSGPMQDRSTEQLHTELRAHLVDYWGSKGAEHIFASLSALDGDEMFDAINDYRWLARHDEDDYAANLAHDIYRTLGELDRRAESNSRLAPTLDPNAIEVAVLGETLERAS